LTDDPLPMNVAAAAAAAAAAVVAESRPISVAESRPIAIAEPRQMRGGDSRPRSGNGVLPPLPELRTPVEQSVMEQPIPPKATESQVPDHIIILLDNVEQKKQEDERARSAAERNVVPQRSYPPRQDAVVPERNNVVPDRNFQPMQGLNSPER